VEGGDTAGKIIRAKRNPAAMGVEGYGNRGYAPVSKKEGRQQTVLRSVGYHVHQEKGPSPERQGAGDKESRCVVQRWKVKNTGGGGGVIKEGKGKAW